MTTPAYTATPCRASLRISTTSADANQFAAGVRPRALLARSRYGARSVSLASIVRIKPDARYAPSCVMHASVDIPTL